MEGGGKDSRGRDKEKKPAGGGAMPCWQRALLALLFFCGPVGTVISFLLLPKEAEPSDALGTRHAPMGAGGGPTRVRMVHLSLADSDRRARFVLDENTVWDTFLSGCRERLQVHNIRRVTDSSGETILAVEDLVHDDHLVIYATPSPIGENAPPLPPSDDLGPAEIPMPGISGAALIASKSRFLLQDGEAGNSSSSESGGGVVTVATDGSEVDAAAATTTTAGGEGGGGGGSEAGVAQRVRSSGQALLSQLSALTHAATDSHAATVGAGDDDDDGAAPPKGKEGPIDGASYAAAVLREAGVHGGAGAAHGGSSGGGGGGSSGGGHAHPAVEHEDDGGGGGDDATGHTHSHSSSSSSSSSSGGSSGGGSSGGGSGGGGGGGSSGHDGHHDSHHDGHHDGHHPEELAHDGHHNLEDLLKDPLYDQENPSRPCGERHPQYRIAMLIPWVNDLPVRRQTARSLQAQPRRRKRRHSRTHTLWQLVR